MSFFSGSSFAWVNQGASRRNIMLPHGLSSEPSVRNANLIAIRTCLLVWVAIVIGCDVAVEQPDHHGAGLLFMERWQQLISRYALIKDICLQGCYNADTPKPTALISNHTKFRLKNQLTADDQKRIEEKEKALVVKKRDVQGKVKITGRREILKSTQCYTREFGKAIIAAWRTPCDSRFNKYWCTRKSSTSRMFMPVAFRYTYKFRFALLQSAFDFCFIYTYIYICAFIRISSAKEHTGYHFTSSSG